MSSESVIIVFLDSVSPEKISEYADDIEKNEGTVTHRFWQQGGINGFSATLPVAYLDNFKSLQASAIDYVEGDGIVTTQAAAQ